MAEQLDLLPEYDAHGMAVQLNDALASSDDPSEVLAEFFVSMKIPGACKRDDSYAFLEVVGVGVMRECFLWVFHDDSILMLGWKGEDEVVVGVLPPGSVFHPVPYDPSGIPTIH